MEEEQYIGHWLDPHDVLIVTRGRRCDHGAIAPRASSVAPADAARTRCGLRWTMGSPGRERRGLGRELDKDVVVVVVITTGGPLYFSPFEVSPVAREPLGMAEDQSN